jgi:signal transduction histidine kinase
MVGISTDWIDAGNRNYASYTNLDPGEYIFQVKGSNSDDVWNENGISIDVTIAPPYWQTWWFRILVAGVLIGSMYGAYRYRLKRVIELERLRLRIAHDLHDDVGSNLSAIAIATRTVQHSQKLTSEAKRKLAEIYETAVLTQEGMRDLVWFIKPDKDRLDDLFVRMKETAASLLEDLEVDVQFPEPGDSRKIPVDFKRSVFLAFKETLTNIVKHASASRVEINVALRDGMLEMVVCDNGRGFDINRVHRGTGLQSLRRRAQTLGGSFEIASQPHGGTSVRFTGKLQTG